MWYVSGSAPSYPIFVTFEFLDKWCLSYLSMTIHYTTYIHSLRCLSGDPGLLTSNRSLDALEVDSFISVNLDSEYSTDSNLIFNEDQTNQMNI